MSSDQSLVGVNQPRIHHIRSAPDGGVYQAMNYGKQCASGAWVWFAGAGDLPSAQTWAAFLADSEALNSACPLHVFGVELDNDREGGVPARYPARWDRSMRWRNTTHHQGMLYRRDLIQSRAFDPAYRVLADYALHLALWWRAFRGSCMVKRGRTLRQAACHAPSAQACTVKNGG